MQSTDASTQRQCVCARAQIVIAKTAEAFCQATRIDRVALEHARVGHGRRAPRSSVRELDPEPIAK